MSRTSNAGRPSPREDDARRISEVSGVVARTEPHRDRRLEIYAVDLLPAPDQQIAEPAWLWELWARPIERRSQQAVDLFE